MIRPEQRARVIPAFFSLIFSLISFPALAATEPGQEGSVFVEKMASRVPAQDAGEGPAWERATKTLYFVGNDKITRLHPDGSLDIYRHPAGGANGLLFDKQGRLVACEAANRRVTRTEPGGGITVLADRFEGHQFNSPNDVTMDSKGRIYFSDPRYGSRDTMEMRDANGKYIEGVYRIDGTDQVARVLGPEVERANGVLVEPGDKHLFVADNNNNTSGGARKLWRFDLKGDGKVDAGSRKLIFDWGTSRGPDGFKMDSKKRLFVAAGLNKDAPPFETADPFRAGIYVLSYEGKMLEFLPIPNDEVTNCAFGGENLKTLFITAGGTLWKIRLK
jgi:gluconolactonase